MAKSIVIAVDTEERTPDAIALGRVLAASTEAPTTLVTVLPYAPFVGDPEEPRLARLREEAAEMLSGLGREMGLEDAAVEIIAGSSVARELHQVTERADTGLIVVGSTTRGPIGRLLVGGVGERLLGGAASAVAIAPVGYGEGAPSSLKRIGVGVDASEESQRALDAAVALARKSGAAIRIITAFQPVAFGGVATAALPSASANETLRAELGQIHENALATARETVEASGRFTDGSADNLLLDESANLDLLVAGSRGYGPIRAVLMGSVTTALAHGATCPILVTPRGTRFDLLDA